MPQKGGTMTIKWKEIEASGLSASKYEKDAYKKGE